MLKAVSNNDRRDANLPLVPTVNSLRFFSEYLNRMISTLEHHTSHRLKFNSTDATLLRKVIIKSAYTALLFDELLDKYGDEIPGQFDFSDEMQRIIRLTSREVNTPMAVETISIAVFAEVGDVLKDIIDGYYYVPVKRPFWRAWFG